MKDEIKEKLDNLRIYVGKEENGFICDIEDYITNLKQEKQEMKNGWQQEVYDKNEVLNKWLDLQVRIDKAIEYIKENICDIDFMKKEYGEHFRDYDIETTFKDIEKLLNILIGGDDND